MTLVAAAPTQDEGEGLDALPTVPVECQCAPCRRRRQDKARRSPEELPAKVARTTRTIKAVTRAVEAGDFTGPEDLAALSQLAQAAEDALGQAVRSLRLTHGYSWADVARGLGEGTTRQAAQQRFGRYCKEDTQP